MDWNRRNLLKVSGAAGMLAAFGDRIADIREAHAHQVVRSGDRADGLPGTGAYGLDPAITYLNHASIGTIPRTVQAAHFDYLALCESNPWLHIWGSAWDEPRRRLRQKAAVVLGASADAIALTHNTTEAFNLAAHGLPLGRGDEVLYPHINHDGASVAWTHMASERGFRVRHFQFPLARVPEIDTDAILALYDAEISGRTRVLVLPHMDNIVGLLQPVREIASLARQRGVEFIAVDAAQTVGMVPVRASGLDVDLYATSGHKWLQGPKGTGIAYLSEQARQLIRPMWVTWGQDRWAGSVRVFEDYGTRDLPGLLTLEDSIDFQSGIPASARAEHYRKLRSRALARCDAAADLKWASPRDPDLSGSLFSVELTRESADAAFARLNAGHGFVFRPFRAPAPNVIRLSPNLANTTDDIDRLFDALARA